MAWNRERMANSTPAAAANAAKLRKVMTNAEKLLWNGLRYDLNIRAGAHFRRQFAIGNYVVDFVCLNYRLVIEVDGPVHDEINQERRDKVRDEFLRHNGFTVLRFSNEEVLLRRLTVINSIAAALSVTTPIRPLKRTPSPQGGRLEISS